MSRSFQPKATALPSDSGEAIASHDSNSEHLIPCRQCSERYPKSTIVCPRCNRWNDCSPLSFALRATAIVVVTAMVIWTLMFVSKAASKTKGVSGEGGLKPLPSAAPGSSGGPDLRF